MPLFLKLILGLVLAAGIQLAPRTAAAQAPGSVFSYAFQGLGTGAPIGLSAGYLLTRDESWGAEDWQDLGLGAAIGAISGAAGGLAIGLADLSDGRAGLGAIVLRDTWYGTMLGVTIGAIVGAVRLMDSGTGEDMLVSMAWGAVIGAPVGIGVGFIEAALRDDVASSNFDRQGVAARRSSNVNTSDWHVAITPVVSGPNRQFGLMPTLTGSF